MNSKKTLFVSFIFLFLFSGVAYGDFQTSFKAGRQAFSQKQFDLALKNYQEAKNQTEIPGQRYQTLLAISDVYQARGDWANAEKVLEQILKDESIAVQNRMFARNRLGDCKLKQKKVEAAVAEYQKVESSGVQNNESEYAQLACGNLLLQLKKYEDAQKYFQLLLANQKASSARRTQAQIGMGNIMFASGKYEDAIAALKEIAWNPKEKEAVRAAALTVIARAQFRLKAYKDICQTDFAIIALNNIPGYYKAAAYMQLISILEGAMKDYTQAKKLLDEFEKMPGLNASQAKWIETYRAKIKKAEYTI